MPPLFKQSSIFLFYRTNENNTNYSQCLLEYILCLWFPDRYGDIAGWSVRSLYSCGKHLP